MFYEPEDSGKILFCWVVVLAGSILAVLLVPLPWVWAAFGLGALSAIVTPFWFGRWRGDRRMLKGTFGDSENDIML